MKPEEILPQIKDLIGELQRIQRLEARHTITQGAKMDARRSYDPPQSVTVRFDCRDGDVVITLTLNDAHRLISALADALSEG